MDNKLNSPPYDQQQLLLGPDNPQGMAMHPIPGSGVMMLTGQGAPQVEAGMAMQPGAGMPMQVHQAPQPGQVVVAMQPSPIVSNLGAFPATLTCQSCHMNVSTRVEESIKGIAWLFCLACGLFPGLLVCCMNGFK